jgi:bifunctional DNA-binding transcriptional regulator/antitoxin component of YhaV-PrlF toxin-antitoxin module
VVGLGLVEEKFVARVFARGKVTIPLAVRDVLSLEDGDYVRVSITEVIKRSKGAGAKKMR